MSITTEQALDMMPHAVEIFEKVDLKGYYKRVQEENKGKKVDVESVGLDAILYVVKNITKVKSDIFEMIAIAEETSVEEVKKQSLVKTIKSFKDIFQDEDLMDFFKTLG